jgi:hypothetical protein
MRIRIIPALVVALFVLVVATPVLGQGMSDAAGRGEASAQSQGSKHSHAADNADRGMNREGSPGEWKDGGHQPSENSAPQGHSPSDPDGMGNGGMDKPGEDGGFDDDKDGNNGCGNDADREDDNNGWCGKPPFAGRGGRTSPSPSPSPSVESSPSVTPSVAPTEAERIPARVLGLQLHRTFAGAPLGGALARTGVAVAGLAAVGFGLMAAGSAMRKRPRR